MNENYAHPAMPRARRRASSVSTSSVNGPRRKCSCSLRNHLREAIAAAELLEADFGVAADLWSVTSFSELRREGLAADRWNALHPGEQPRIAMSSRY